MTLKLGGQVPDLTLARPDGTAITFAAFAGRPLVVIFLRHLA